MNHNQIKDKMLEFFKSIRGKPLGNVFKLNYGLWKDSKIKNKKFIFVMIILLIVFVRKMK